MKNPTIKVVRVYDPAFAGAPLSAIKRYGETRAESDIPPATPGESGPVVFHVRRLTRSEVEEVEVAQSDERRWTRAFNLGVTRISGARFGDGWEPASAGAKRAPITDEELDEAQIAPQDQKEIGGVIYAMSTRPFDCSAAYRLLPSSAAVWDDNAARYAAAREKDPPPNSGPPEDEQG